MSPSDEQYIFKKFKELCTSLPEGEPTFPDMPDVIYTTNLGKTIGIEITECYYNEFLKASSEFTVKFNKEVINNIEEDFEYPFILDIELNHENPIKLKFRNSIIKDLRKICVKEFSKLNPRESKKLENIGEIESFGQVKELLLSSGYRHLPESILSITMTRVDGIEKSFHLETTAGVVPSFNDEILNKIIKSKEKSLLQYKKCDENWLLICEGIDFYSYFSDIDLKEKIVSDFNKIFLYRKLHSQVVQLK